MRLNYDFSSALDDFNNGVVLTNRTLKPNEIFEVRIDRMVDKWAGSIEIGLTLHSPESLEFPSTMTNIRSGTWMMTGNGVMYNGTTVMDDYGQNLDRLKVSGKVKISNDQEMLQSELKSHPKKRGRKKNIIHNQVLLQRETIVATQLPGLNI